MADQTPPLGPPDGLPRGNRRTPNPDTTSSSPQVELVAAFPKRPGRKWRGWAIGAALLAVGAVSASWFALPIKQVTVTGNARLSAARVQELAGLTPGFGWLYYGTWRARGLLDSPWIQSAVITRRFPDSVSVAVTERQPVARWQQEGGQVLALALDGTVMPGALGLEQLPLIQGWGPERVPQALKVLGALGSYNVQSVTYTPTGLKVVLPAGTVWSGDPDSLLKYAGSISMYPNKTINIYPWGVSVQE